MMMGGWQEAMERRSEGLANREPARPDQEWCGMHSAGRRKCTSRNRGGRKKTNSCFAVENQNKHSARGLQQRRCGNRNRVGGRALRTVCTGRASVGPTHTPFLETAAFWA